MVDIVQGCGGNSGRGIGATGMLGLSVLVPYVPYCIVQYNTTGSASILGFALLFGSLTIPHLDWHKN
jgi:hypothetical protein